MDPRRRPEVILAFDTAEPIGSVAVGIDGSIVSSVLLRERTEHAARLVPAIQEALAAAALTPAQISAVAVGEGPGSFTGVRVAAATAKGLVQALGVPLRPVSSLLAWGLAREVGPVRYVLFDARGERIYGGCFSVDDAGVRLLAPPRAGTLHEVLAGPVPAGAVFMGSGAEQHRGRIEEAGFVLAPAEEEGERTGSATGILRALALGPYGAAVEDPGGWEPEYLRAASVERA